MNYGRSSNEASPLKILVVGCGSIGERHIKNLESIGGTEIMACDSEKERLEHIKGTYELQTFPDYEQALSSQVFDGVLICTPTSSHVPLALAAIQRGCHVLVEKPLSHTLEGVDNLIKEAKDRNLTLMVGFNLRFHPNLQQIKAILDSHEIGKPLNARTHFGSYLLYRLPYHYYEDYRQDYATKKIGGGVILDAATHSIDYLRWFFGEIKEVFGYSGKMSNLDLEAEDLAEILLKFRKGVIASLHVDFIQQPFQNKCEIIGETGTITWDATTNSVSVFTAKENKWQVFRRDDFDYNETYRREMEHFLNCIRGTEQPAVDGTAGKRVLEVALAAKTSAQRGGTVKL